MWQLIEKLYIKMLTNKRYINLLKKRGIKIGEHCSISKSVGFGSEPYLITIGNNVRLTHNVQFITHDGGLWVLRNLKKELKNADKIGKIEVGNNVNIGWNAIIMPNVKIGDNVVIGAGAIVTKNIPSNTVACGIPAKIIESIDEYYDKCKDKVLFTKNMNKKEKKEYLLKKLK